MSPFRLLFQYHYNITICDIIFTMSVIKVEKLTKTFRKVKAICDIDISIREGSITGFLGPNGSGKSTTMNVLLGFINATLGEAKIFDEKVSVNNVRTRRDVGFLSSNMALDKTLTAQQELEYFGYLNKKFDQKYVSELARKLNLDLKQKIGQMSTGNHQKVALIIALMGRPKLLILDEPTNGLDPLVQAEFNKIIRELADNGSTVFISSHILSEVDELCDEFVFIKKGKIVANISKDELLKKAGKSITIKPTDANRSDIIAWLKKNKIEYEIEATDLEATFMHYYEDDGSSDV